MQPANQAAEASAAAAARRVKQFPCAVLIWTDPARELRKVRPTTFILLPRGTPCAAAQGSTRFVVAIQVGTDFGFSGSAGLNQEPNQEFDSFFGAGAGIRGTA